MNTPDQTPSVNPIIEAAFEGQTVRIVMDGEKPLFVAKDVCDILEVSKYRDAVARLKEHQRVSVNVDTPGGPQTMTAATESGLLKLVFQSRKPKAERFADWVVDEVLPQVLTKGYYLPQFDSYEQRLGHAHRHRERACNLRAEAAREDWLADQCLVLEEGVVIAHHIAKILPKLNPRQRANHVRNVTNQLRANLKDLGKDGNFYTALPADIEQALLRYRGKSKLIAAWAAENFDGYSIETAKQ